MNLISKESKKLLLAVVILASVIGYLDAEDAPSSAEESQGNQEAALKYLGPALKDRGGVARIDYLAACAAKDGTPLPFPRVVVQPPSKGTSGLAAVREIFRNDKKVSVSENPPGMIRVTIGHPVLSILQTRIGSLTLDREDRYNAAQAIVTILGCKDVQAAMRQLGFGQPLTVSSIGIAPFEKRAPHLPARISDLTMDQALNNVAKTFGGIVIYEECANANGKRLFSLAFTQAMDP